MELWLDPNFWTNGKKKKIEKMGEIEHELVLEDIKDYCAFFFFSMKLIFWLCFKKSLW